MKRERERETQFFLNLAGVKTSNAGEKKKKKKWHQSNKTSKRKKSVSRNLACRILLEKLKKFVVFQN